MIKRDKSYIILLIKNEHTLFCYYNISSSTIKEFEEKHGESSWGNSTPVIKLYFIENGISREKETIYIDRLANNWYINIEEDDKDVYVELGRLLQSNEYIPVIASSSITTPRAHVSGDSNLYFVNVNEHNSIIASNVTSQEDNPKPLFQKKNLKNISK